MSDNKSALITAFEGAPSISGRYTDLRCVNFRPGDTKKERGGYSLVFRATDTQTGVLVALKIMDPDHLSDVYRMDCFAREPTIIGALPNHHRCLKLVDGHKVFDIDVSLPGAGTLKYPVGFFVTEWLDDDIEDYFLNQQLHDAAAKLAVFRQIVLAVKVLHENRVYHRDLKRDNFRIRTTSADRPVITIDFGTSAKTESPHLATSYATPVGHGGYAPPEAFAGLAGFRQFGHLADTYDLGGLLYELFMPDFFFIETINNPVFRLALSAALYKSRLHPIERRAPAWAKLVRDFAKAVQPPSIVGPGSSVPPAIRGQLSDVYSRLAAFDFHKRVSNLDQVVRSLDGALRCITNQKLWTRQQAARRKIREDRLRKATEKEVRVRSRQPSAVPTSAKGQ